MSSAKPDTVIIAHTCASCSLTGPLAILFAFCLCSQLSFSCSCQSYCTCFCKERSLSVFPTFWDWTKEQTFLHKASLSYLIYFLTKGKMTLSTQQRTKLLLKTWNANDNSIIRRNFNTFRKFSLCLLHYRLWTSDCCSGVQELHLILVLAFICRLLKNLLKTVNANLSYSFHFINNN